jgi:hypothetical protein
MAVGWRAGTGHPGRCSAGPRQCSGQRKALVAIVVRGGRDGGAAGGENTVPRVIKHLIVLPRPRRRRSSPCPH